MPEKRPAGLGRAMPGMRAGFDKIVSAAPEFAAVVNVIALESPAFDDEGRIPPRFTTDGAKLSPPLKWSGAPADTKAIALVIEDPDAPGVKPLVHLLAWDLAPALENIPEGYFAGTANQSVDRGLGRNSYLRAVYLPPDPPPGHGPHRYVFQMFALDRALEFPADASPGRRALVEAMHGHVLAKGVLVGVYARN